MDSVELSLSLGIDPSRDVPAGNCRCGDEGHRLLHLCASRQAKSVGAEALVWNSDLVVARAKLRQLRAAGMIFLLAGREGGWPASWWSAQATPAGLRHATQIDGSDDRHGGACGGNWDPDARCMRCQAKRPLTIELAARRLTAMPSGPERDRERWASQFVCPSHGRARAATVRTDKCCSACGALLLRATPVEAA